MTNPKNNGFPDNLMEQCLPALAVQMLVKRNGITEEAETNIRNLSAIIDDLHDAWETCCQTGFRP